MGSCISGGVSQLCYDLCVTSYVCVADGDEESAGGEAAITREKDIGLDDDETSVQTAMLDDVSVSVTNKDYTVSLFVTICAPTYVKVIVLFALIDGRNASDFALLGGVLCAKYNLWQLLSDHQLD